MKKRMNGFAWMLANAAETNSRKPTRAVELAKEVVKYAPNFADKWITLGVAYYQAGGWKNAITAIEESEALAPGRFGGVTGFVLAMSNWKLGEKERARGFFERAVQWMDQNQPKNEELRRF